MQSELTHWVQRSLAVEHPDTDGASLHWTLHCTIADARFLRIQNWFLLAAVNLRMMEFDLLSNAFLVVGLDMATMQIRIVEGQGELAVTHIARKHSSPPGLSSTTTYRRKRTRSPSSRSAFEISPDAAEIPVGTGGGTIRTSMTCLLVSHNLRRPAEVNSHRTSPCLSPGSPCLRSVSDR